MRTLFLSCLFVAVPGIQSCSSSTTPVGADAASDVVALDTATTDVNPADAPSKSDVLSVPDAPFDPPVMVESCAPVRPGTVTNFMVDGAARSFLLTVPSAAAADRIGDGGTPPQRWPVVFNWHGFGSNAGTMNAILAGQVDSPTMPFILVTPTSTGLGPATTPPGLDWDQIAVTTPNREAHLFDATLRCLDERYGIDRERVYTVGFSAGAILSNLLGTIRGDQLAAVASFSGAYFNNPANTEMLGAVSSLVTWPEFNHERRYPQMLVYGGMRDNVSLAVVTARFQAFAEADIPVLRARGHDLVVCPHGGAHVVPAALAGENLVRFFAAHPRSVRRSPWSAGLPMGYPSYCTLQTGM
jgi:predicted esterase